MNSHARDSIVNSYLRKGKMGKQVYLDLKTDFVEKAKFIHENTNTDVTKPIDILKLINYFTDIVLDEDTTSKKSDNVEFDYQQMPRFYDNVYHIQKTKTNSDNDMFYYATSLAYIMLGYIQRHEEDEMMFSFIKNIDHEVYKRMKLDAKTFAAFLLLPYNRFVEVVEKNKDDNDMVDFSIVADEFKVSTALAIVFAKEVGMIPVDEEKIIKA